MSEVMYTLTRINRTYELITMITYINDKAELGEVVEGTASLKTGWVLVGSRGRRCREGGRACWPSWTAPVLFFHIWKIGSDW